jgi:hypothetical protein
MPEHREHTSSGAPTEHVYPGYRNIRRRRISRHPGRIERVLASIALFVLRSMRPKLPPDHVRLEWSCTCGVHMYADYPDSGDFADFQGDLGDAGKRHPSFAHIIGFESRLTLLFIVNNPPWFVALFALPLVLWQSTSDVARLFDNVHKQELSNKELISIAVSLLCTLSTAILFGELPIFRSCGWRKLYAYTYPASLTAHSDLVPEKLPSANAQRSVDLASHSEQPDAGSSAGPTNAHSYQSGTTTSSTSAGGRDLPAYLELCVSRGLWSCHWGEIKLRDDNEMLVENDARMFGTYSKSVPPP